MNVVNKNFDIRIINLGLVDYKKASKIQSRIYDFKAKAKLGSISKFKNGTSIPDFLIICQHPHVYTIGKNGINDNLLVDEAFLKSNKIKFYDTNRGGDITYHGPGQIVLYPILDLEKLHIDIGKYLRFLEDCVIETLNEFKIIGLKLNGFTGVWVKIDNRLSKICSIGIKISKFITTHGLALNVNNDLKYFEYIVPCGIKNVRITSVKEILGKHIDIDLVADRLREHTVRKLSSSF